jgi:hypothetical protein
MSNRPRASARLTCVAAFAPGHQADIGRTSFMLVLERDEYVLYRRDSGVVKISGGL